MRWKFNEFTLTSQYCTYFLFNLPEEFCIYCWPWHILNERCLTEPLTHLFLPHKNDSFRTKITFFTTPLFYDDTKSFLLLYSYLPFSALYYSLFFDGFYSFCFLANLSSFWFWNRSLYSYIKNLLRWPCKFIGISSTGFCKFFALFSVSISLYISWPAFFGSNKSVKYYNTFVAITRTIFYFWLCRKCLVITKFSL